jgi:hypothetical protein
VNRATRARTQGKEATLSNTRLFLVASLACMLSGGVVHAADTGAADAPQAEQRILLDTIRANRKAFVAVNLDLSPVEAEKFWPLYDRYQKEISVIGDRVVAIVDEYTATFRDLPNDKAMQLMESYLAAEAERLKVRRTYLADFAKIVPGRTVARFYQIENKMDAVLRYEMAATVPVVDEKPGSPAK